MSEDALPRSTHRPPGAFRRWVSALLLLLALPGLAMEHAAFKPGGRQLTLGASPRSGLPPARIPAALNGLAVAGGQLERGATLFASDWRQSTDHPGSLGPRFDAVSCGACHLEAAPPGPQPAPPRSAPLVARLLDAEDRARHGAQLHRVSLGPEAVLAEVRVDGETSLRVLPDGTRVELWRPRVAVAPRAAGRGPAGPVGLRMAPALFGWGLLEAVPDRVLLAVADPADRNGDGIRGRASMVWDLERERFTVGRFGWKAEQPTLRQQTAAALHHDMGITTTLFPGDGCGPLRGVCAPELADPELDRMVEFVRHLGVPERRGPRTPEKRRGEQLFARIGCSSCHLPVLVTGADPNPGLSEQLIWPYTDLLLHDMGPELADPGADQPQAREWRTAPLWGLGQLEAMAPARGLLHDGRARSILEAVLWHGGEARTTRLRFEALAARDREAVIAFLRSL